MQKRGNAAFAIVSLPERIIDTHAKEATMDQARIAFTAVYLKSNHGYVGFIEELPGVNSHGRTLEEARETLHTLAAVVFDEERRGARELVAGKDVVRESFFVALPRAA
jgi:predicted RNase H-like HicB family nuclease